MKQSFLKCGLCVAVLAAVFLTGCGKEKNTVTLGLRAEGVGGSSRDAKVIIDNVTPKWEGGEMVMINGATKTVTMSGTDAQLQEVTEADNYFAVYPYSVASNMNTTDGTVTITLPSTQTYQTDASGNQKVEIPMGAYGDGNGGLTFKNLCSLVKVSITNNGVPIKVTSISLTANNNGSAVALCGTGSVTVKNNNAPQLAITSGATNCVTLSMSDGGVTVGGGTKSFYLVVAPFAAATDLQIAITAAGYSSAITKTLSSNVSLARNSIASATVTTTAEIQSGTTSEFTKLGGVFSVSESKQVQFAKGNLNYNFNTRKFGFNSEQYTYTANNNGNSTTWEYFGWSGNSTYGLLTSTDNADYRGATNDEFHDWGTALYAGSQWRTLTKEEWVYLFNTRSASTINGTANARYAEVKVNGVNGIILFPDSFTWPSDDVATMPSIINDNANNTWNTYNYTTDEWSFLEDEGCVFLPAAGYRYGTSVYNVGSYGYYWSATPDGSTYAYFLFFFGTNVSPQTNYCRYYGFSVRLVQDCSGSH